MWEDPIVAEVHRAREKLAAECNFDIKAANQRLKLTGAANLVLRVATSSQAAPAA
jgi:hypothetical protein